MALKTELDQRLNEKHKDLQTILFESIIEIRKKYPEARKMRSSASATMERNGPSAAITVVRLKDGRMEYFALGDCILSVMYTDDSVEIYTNEDLVRLDNKVFHYMKEIAEALNPAEANAPDTVRKAAALQAINAEKLANRNLKNKEGGYWILDLSGEGVPRGAYRTFNPDIIKSVVLMTDGLSDLYNSGLSKEEIHRRLMEDPAAVVEYLKVEYENDPNWTKYPRFKAVDDITSIGVKMDHGSH